MRNLYRDFVAQSGYALLCFSVVTLLLEQVMTGFVTPYLHPYLTGLLGLALAGLGSIQTSALSRSRWIISGFMVVSCLWLVATKILSVRSGTVLWLACALLGVAFFVAHLYHRDV